MTTEKKLADVLMINDFGEVAPRKSWQEKHAEWKRRHDEKFAPHREAMKWLMSLQRRPCPHCGEETIFSVCGDCDDERPVA